MFSIIWIILFYSKEKKSQITSDNDYSVLILYFYIM